MMGRTIGKNRAWSGRKRSFLLFFTMLFVLCPRGFRGFDPGTFGDAVSDGTDRDDESV